MMRRMMRLDDAQDDAARSCYGTCEIRLDDAQEWTLVVNVPHVGQGKMRMTILSYPDDETASNVSVPVSYPMDAASQVDSLDHLTDIIEDPSEGDHGGAERPASPEA